jgi:RNA polymerase sigma factor (sigma-70 family)
MMSPGDLEDRARTGTQTPYAGPTEREARELLEVARLGAQAANARGPDVDDIAQTVVLKLTKKWNDQHVVAARGRGPNGWHAYITVAARNAFRDLMRARARAWSRQVRAVHRTEGAALHERPGVNRSHPDQTSNVDRFLARLLLADLIAECQMTPRQREVVALHLIDGLSCADIAVRLGLSVRTVNDHKLRAFRILRSELHRSLPSREVRA